MTYLICHGLYIFFVILEGVLFFYILLSWLPQAVKLRAMLFVLLEPVFVPLRFCLRHSVFNSNGADLTPMVALIVLSFLQSLFYNLSA